jgi:YD repeat-containing protein
MLYYASGGSWTQTYNYDTGERLYQIKNGATTIAQYGYDPLSRLQSVSLVDTSSIARTYEPDDDLATITHTYTGGVAGVQLHQQRRGTAEDHRDGHHRPVGRPPSAP